MLTALAHHETVFSAHAEVVPWPLRARWAVPGILRARGGSSVVDDGASTAVLYSPRTRR